MDRRWWQSAIGYQIYPRSFYDTNHDGMGDLRGIIEKLDYIKSLNVTCLWISPFYPSPLDDNGYDISDFRGVDPQLGSLEDFKELLDKAHQRGIRILLDCVLNQTSDEHPWFMEARHSVESNKRDYYIWGKGQNGNPPNNWGSFFGGSAWEYDEGSEEYYLKIFSKKMPDLNWSNKLVQQEMEEMVRYWLDMGVDGFRMDAISHLGKDMSLSNSELEEKDGIAYDWSKFSNRDQLYEYLHSLHKNVLRHYDIVTIGEVGGGAKFNDALRYVNKERPTIDMVFNFDTTWHNIPYGYEVLVPQKFEVDVISLKRDMEYWVTNSQKHNIHPPVYWHNHDHPRALSQYGSLEFHRESGTMLGMVLLTLPGTPFIYNGEEIGMTNIDYTNPEDFKDVNSRNFFELNKNRLSMDEMMNHMRYTGRDSGHLPMQWSDDEHAGFSSQKPYLKIVQSYKSVNVAKQENDPNSILNMYRQMAKLRLENPEDFVFSDFVVIDKEHPDVFTYERGNFLVISNWRDREVPYKFDETLEVIAHNYQDTLINTLRPYECLVVKIK